MRLMSTCQEGMPCLAVWFFHCWIVWFGPMVAIPNPRGPMVRSCFVRYKRSKFLWFGDWIRDPSPVKFSAGSIWASNLPTRQAYLNKLIADLLVHKCVTRRPLWFSRLPILWPRPCASVVRCDERVAKRFDHSSRTSGLYRICTCEERHQ